MASKAVPPPADSSSDEISPKLAMEFFGVFALTFTIITLIATHAASAWLATAIAFTVMVLVYAGAAVSGGHYNPAITVGLNLAGAISGADAAKYIAVQFLAGLGGALAGFGMYGIEWTVKPAAGYSHFAVGAAEIIYTGWLVFTVLAVAVGSPGNQYFGLSIGLAILTGAASVGGISGAYMNPAISLGVDLASMGIGFGHSLMYVVYEFLGAVGAAFLYQFLYSETGLAQKLTAEFVGVFMLTFSAGLIVISGAAHGAFAIASTLACIVYTMGPVSGAHVNPAVTIGILASGRNKVTADDAWKYIVAQLLGGVVGGLGFGLMTEKSFALLPAPGSTLFGAWYTEIFFTSLLVLTVLACATTASMNKDMFGFLIGMCVLVAGMAAGAQSGGVLNPAVASGVGVAHAFVDSQHDFLSWGSYVTAEIAGAGLAAGIFFNSHVAEYKGK